MKSLGIMCVAAIALVPGMGIFAQRAVLPHDDPSVSMTAASEKSADRKEDIRNQRLKQQGQGADRRVEGKPQAQENVQGPSGKGPGQELQDTGLADPRVNPGQAEGGRR